MRRIVWLVQITLKNGGIRYLSLDEGGTYDYYFRLVQTRGAATSFRSAALAHLVSDHFWQTQWRPYGPLTESEYASRTVVPLEKRIPKPEPPVCPKCAPKPKGRPRGLDDAEVLGFRRLGLSLSQIADRFGVSRGAIQKSLKRSKR